MLLEAVRIWADALEDASYGVNAQLSGVERDTGDPQPPDVKWVRDVTRDTGAVEGRLGSDWPGIIVGPDGTPATAEGQVTTEKRDARDVAVVAEWVSGKSDLGQAIRDGSYTLRAIQRTLDDLFETANESDRSRNNIRMLNAQELTFAEIIIDDETGRVVLPTTIRFHMRDDNP